jgi:uncharacterized lipoprotein YddW (UPF0748 family)
VGEASRGAARGAGVPASGAAGAGLGAPGPRLRSGRPEQSSRDATNDETRALWVQRGTLTSATSVVTLINAAKAAGFNTLLVQARGRGDAYYVSRIEPRGAALAKQDSFFDPLELAVTAGHHAGLRVHAWVNINLIADADLPTARTHVVYTHPEWLMVPRDLADEAARIDQRSPEYAGMLARYARANSDRIEGLYLSAIQPAAANYTVSVIRDIAARYAVDGIHIDYARFPNDDFDYSPGALAEFRAEVLPHLTAAERREYDGRAAARGAGAPASGAAGAGRGAPANGAAGAGRGAPATNNDGRVAARVTFYTQMFPERWQDFRRARITALVTQLRAAVKDARPQALFSAAVWPEPNEAAARRFQDWRAWVNNGLLDVICPMAYTSDASTFRAQIAAVKQVAGRRPVWAGIGAYRLSAADTVANIQSARRIGVEGISLFSYDNLTPDANPNPQYLQRVAQGAFGP